MNFDLTDEQQALADLAAQILADQLPPERLTEIEATAEGFAERAWSEMAKAGLLGVAVPEEHGGLGFGLLEACLVAEQVGRYVAPIPYLASVVYGGMTVGRFGTPDQCARWLPGLADGSTILTAALIESGLDITPGVPATTASPAGDGGWRLDGVKQLVPAAHLAAAVLVPASTPEGVRVFVVDPRAAGVGLVRQPAMNREPQWQMTLADVEVSATDVLGDAADGTDVLAWLVEHAAVAHCAVQAGVCEGALRITARYVSEREQFGTKIGTFQAVGHRAADAYIDTQAVRLTMLAAAWALTEGRPAAAEVATAKLWAAEGGQRVVHAAQHLHGGIGVDTDYPVHRYFRWAKVHELTLGGASQHLSRLGALLAG